VALCEHARITDGVIGKSHLSRRVLSARGGCGLGNFHLNGIEGDAAMAVTAILLAQHPQNLGPGRVLANAAIQLAALGIPSVMPLRDGDQQSSSIMSYMGDTKDAACQVHWDEINSGMNCNGVRFIVKYVYDSMYDALLLYICLTCLRVIANV